MGPGSPFPDYVKTNEIERTSLLHRFRAPRASQFVHKAGCESWSTAWAPDSSYLAWSSGNRIVRLIPWNRYKNKPVEEDDEDPDGHVLDLEARRPLEIDTSELVWALAFGSSTCHHSQYGRQETRPDGSVRYRFNVAKDLILATGLARGRIRLWDVLTGRQLFELCDHLDVIRDMQFSPDGSMRLASASRDGTIKMWDLEDDGNMIKTLRGTSKWLYNCAFSPDAKMLCGVGDSRAVMLWDTKKFKLLRKLTGHHNDVCGCDFSPDGALLVTSSYDTRAIVWDPHTGEQLRVFGHMFPQPSMLFAGGSNDSYVRGVSFSRDGMHIASISDDTFIRFWDLHKSETPVQVATLNNTLCCVYSPDGAALAVGTRDGSLAVFTAPMRVTSLQHLCRLAVRHMIPSSQRVQALHMPLRLKQYLLYTELRDGITTPTNSPAPIMSMG